ncbi:MAG: glycosyltransferase [Cryomorphaceae bacterium]|nr:glycosyltransferase [Cryomorphaceae bacterium]
MRTLHITSWYPSDKNPKEALWIQRQIEASEGEYDVLHLQVTSGPFQITRKLQDRERAFLMSIPTRSWRIIEFVTGLLLWYYLKFVYRLKNYDHLHFHISYPLLTYFRFLRTVQLRISVSEHWSAFHFNFHSTKPLTRIKRIFTDERLHFIFVSQALANDVERFAGRSLKHSIVPNLVDKSVFFNTKAEKTPRSIFMLSYWKNPKRPLVILQAVLEINRNRSKDQQVQLRIGGYGPQMIEIQSFIDLNNLSDSVQLLGSLTSEEAAIEMNRAQIFAHCSDYETFSVVCAEAIACETFVVASAVGGIPEFVNAQNGYLVADNDVKSWSSVLPMALK